MRLETETAVLEVYKECIQEVNRKYEIVPVDTDTEFRLIESTNTNTAMTSWKIDDRSADILLMHNLKDDVYTVVFDGFGDGRLLSLSEIIDGKNITDNDFYFPMVLTQLGAGDTLMPETLESSGVEIYAAEMTKDDYEILKDSLKNFDFSEVTVLGTVEPQGD